ncbi:gastric triacylglycerol lipase [Rhipicephalus sanguineus]|uniref:gastric triacylglycerol lipase n=1 Tax=Rhipicephalus sanguineus TaxID=34632 RepID=UPI00189480F8|nr:gastric triacylglycerol lipase [Rhipicephalus sanguineus]
MVSPSTAISRLIPSLLLGTVRTALDFPAEMANFYTGGDPDQCSGIEQLIRSKGYPFERHNVITSDGYIIEMHRIPHGREPCKEPCHRQPILLMSGLLGDSSNYVLDFPKQSLGYVLADHKYDVWMGNVRGNTYGKRHKKFNARSRRFWNFSFHEHSKYDLPAQIDYVLKNTSRTDLLYLGLSQGTLMFFTMMSEKPKYNDKVKAFAGLAPFNKLSHMDVDALAMLVPLADHITRMAITLGHYEIMPQGFPMLPLFRTFCALPTRAVCSFLGDGLTNLGSKYMNESRIPVYLCYLPAGTSLKNIVHFSQLIKSKKATKFDYGPEDNKIYYGQEEPPEYKLSNVKTDVGIFWSRGDQFVPPANVRELIKDLGPLVKKNHFIDDPYYTHLHFAMALNNPRLLYKDLLEFLDQYATSS